MTHFLPKIFIDYSSFWAGVIIASVLLFLFLRYRNKIQEFLTDSQQKIIAFRDHLAAASESDYFNLIYHYVQGLHISADICPLEMVLVPPKCIAPPPVIFPGQDNIDPSLIQQSIGYDPLFPELSVEYFAPTFPLIDALSQHTNLCLVGLPGTGKTVAIADCITTLLRSEKAENGSWQKIPFYVKAHHILAQFPGKDVLAIILAAIKANPVFSAIPNFPNFLTSMINSGNAVLFVDDQDLLSFSDTNRLANFLAALCRKIPSLQLVTTATPSCLGNLVKVPQELIVIAPWNNADKYAFLKKWSHLWASTLPEQDDDPSNAAAIQNSMLVVSDRFSTPLEFTIKARASYGGDLTGPSRADAIESHIKRCFGSLTGDVVRTLETIALHVLEQENSTFTRREINSWFSEITSTASHDLDDEKISPLTPVLQTAMEHGLIQRDGKDGFYICQPTLGGYLAARALSRSSAAVSQRVLVQPAWSLQYEAVRYLAAFTNVRPLLGLLNQDDSLFLSLRINAASWLEYIPRSSPEELELLKLITRTIHSNDIYFVKIRLITALARSANPNTRSIVQHFLRSDDADTRRAAAVGAGLIQDLAAVPLLVGQLNDPFPSSTAACYALGKIASPNSLEAIADALLHGNELLRRSAAESLAQHRSEGHPALREGSLRDDLLVRYAVVHGLSLVNEPWALEILDKMRINEKEWIVRDLAQQVFAIHQTKSPYLPALVPPAYLNPWLDEFSSAQGLPAPTPENSLDSLLKALEGGTEVQIKAALTHLVREGTLGVLPKLVALFHHPNLGIRQQSFLTAWFNAPPHYSLPASPENSH
jgi:HEAT repeat protein